MIVITGASRGLGKAIAQRLIEKDEKIIGLVRDKEKIDIDIECIECNVCDYESVKNAALEIKRMKQPVKALINAAGVASLNLAVTTDDATVQKLIQTNLVGTIYCCQLFAAAKAGVEAFSRTFAREVADFNLRVNCIAPGPIRTDLLNGVTNAQIENIISQQVITKLFQKSDICDLVELLLDDRASSLSGQVLNVGGA